MHCILISPLQAYRPTSSIEKLTSTAIVANRRVKYTIWDTTGKRIELPL